MTDLADEDIAGLEAENERLRAALKPFADYVRQLEGEIPPSGSGPTRDEWLAARDALTLNEQNEPNR